MATVYPTLQEALFLHERLLARYGGAPGVRDMGMLESALARPRSGYYTSLSEQAAALMDSLARNHALVDGNKRMAFALCAVFLRLNGHRLEADADGAEFFLVESVIPGRVALETIADWLEARLRACT